MLFFQVLFVLISKRVVSVNKMSEKSKAIKRFLEEKVSKLETNEDFSNPKKLKLSNEASVNINKHLEK